MLIRAGGGFWGCPQFLEGMVKMKGVPLPDANCVSVSLLSKTLVFTLRNGGGGGKKNFFWSLALLVLN